MADLAKLVDELSSLTVMEAAELSKMLEEKWGVSAAAPVAVAAAPLLARRCRAGRRADGIHRHPDRRWRQEDQRDQGGPHHHRPRPEGSQGPGRGCAEGREGSACRRTRPRRSRRCWKRTGRRSRSSKVCRRRHIALDAAVPKAGAGPRTTCAGTGGNRMGCRPWCAIRRAARRCGCAAVRRQECRQWACAARFGAGRTKESGQA